MGNFQLLGDLTTRLHSELRQTFYLLLPVFFALAIVFAWFKEPRGGADFIEALKRAFVATLLLAGFQEITDTILLVSNGLSSKISDMSGLDSILKMAGEKAGTYTLSLNSLILGLNDLLIATLSFLSYFVLYIARYIMVALYHFGWVFLSILAPVLLLFHLFTSRITMNLFKSMIEIAAWQVVWSVLSAMLTALPFGNAYVANGNYLTVIVINFIIALCMLGTPLLVHSLVGSGFSGMASALGPAIAGTMIAAPAKAATSLQFGRTVLSDTVKYTKHKTSSIGQAFHPKRSAPPVQATKTEPSQTPVNRSQKQAPHNASANTPQLPAQPTPKNTK